MNTDRQDTSAAPGTLFVVATPIGNLGDISPRAAEVFTRVDCIAAEDTRHSRRLMQHLGVSTPLLALHQHNEARQSEVLVSRLSAGESIALISDAGTPVVSDPGTRLVAAAQQAGITVSPAPGPCAMAAALSCCGLNTEQFRFLGFLPAKRNARLEQLKSLAAHPEAVVIYEAPHRIADCIDDLHTCFGADRPAAICRELTKRHEQVVSATLLELKQHLASGHIPAKGEFVVVVEGNPEPPSASSINAAELMGLLAAELPRRKAAKITAKVTGASANELYQQTLD